LPIVGASWLLGWSVARAYSMPVERSLRRRFGRARSGPSGAAATADV
jgi:hypothetical protein